jgi:hypothetical protein
MQRYTVYYIWKLLYMFRVVLPPIIRSAYNCIYSMWHLSHRYCYLALSWKSWNWFECAVGGVRHPDSSNGVTNTRCCRYSCMRSWWWVEVLPETCTAVSRYNKLCKVASCWIYIGILLGAHYILHSNRIRVKESCHHLVPAHWKKSLKILNLKTYKILVIYSNNFFFCKTLDFLWIVCCFPLQLYVNTSLTVT